MESFGGPGDAPRGGSQSRAGGAARPTEITALLGRGTAFEGKLHFVGRVRIDGHFTGDIRGEDVLVIGEGARVEGTIEVHTCIVTAGEVRADIRARDAIELYPPAKVTGSLHAPAVFIDRGVQFEGTCTMAPLPDASPRAPAPSPTPAPATTPGQVSPAPAGLAGPPAAAPVEPSDREPPP